MKTPPAVRGVTIPAWVTLHNAELAVAGLVILLLAFAVLRLAKGGKVPAPPPVPKSSGAGLKILLTGGAALVGWLLWKRHETAATVKAAPSPSPQPTVTQTVTPHAVPHFALPHLTGGNIVVIFVIAAIVAIVLVGPVLRRSS